MHQDRAGWWATSALGQKQTFALHHPHVRFTPNSDIDYVFRHVRFGPKADILHASSHRRVFVRN
jgi:hypothetical protein